MKNIAASKNKNIFLFMPLVLLMNSCMANPSLQTQIQALKKEVEQLTGKEIKDPAINQSSIGLDNSIPNVDIQGIGIFKIGMTLNELNVLYQNIPEVEMSSSEYYSLKHPIVLVKPKSDNLLFIDLSILNGSFCPQTKQYKVNQYNVSNLNLELEIYFYKDKLFKISTTSALIHNAIETKYGEGKKGSRSKDITCISKLTGLTFSQKESSFSQEWKNGYILASSLLFNSFDSSCKESAYSSFSIENTSEIEGEKKCNEEAIKPVKKSLEEKKKADLSQL